MSLPSLARVRKPAIGRREFATRDPTSLSRIKGSKRTGIAASVVSRANLIQLVEFPELPFRSGFRHAVKDDKHSRVVRTTLRTGAHRISVAYKRIRRIGWKRVRDLIWPRRHLHVWNMARYLVERRVPTALPIALVSPRLWARKRDSYFATQWIEGAVELQSHLDELVRQPAALRARLTKATAESLGSLIGQLHRFRVSHRDLKPANLLITSSGEKAVAHVVDLDGSRIRIWMRDRERLKNLRRLAAGVKSWPQLTWSMHLRFIKAYLLTLRGSAKEWKSTWMRLAR